MSWGPAARTATAVVKLGQHQQQHTALQRQRQQLLQKRQLSHQGELAQPQQSEAQQHQQLRTQRPQRSFLSRASVRRASGQIQDIVGERHRRPPNVSGRSIKNGSGDEAVSGKHVLPTSRSCNSSSSASGEFAVKRGTQPGSAIVASQMFKTKLCIDHQTRGCTRGENCPYAHSVEEMRNLPDLRKTKMCSLVLAGKGCKNRACKFAHSEEELRYTCTFSEFKTRICRFAQERGGRGCLYGVRCPYAHSPSELRPLENSTVQPTDANNPEDKGNGAEVLPCGQRPASPNPTPSGLHDLRGKHGLWGQQRDLQSDHSVAQQQDGIRQKPKEQLKQQHQHQRWQKSQQYTSPPQALRPQKQYQQQQDAHQQKRQPRMQPRHQKPQHLRVNQACDGWTNVKFSCQQSQQAEDGGEVRSRESIEETAVSCIHDSCRRAPADAAFQSALRKEHQMLVDPNESHEQLESSAVAKLPQPLNKGTRATSAVVDANEAGFNIGERRSQEGKRLDSAGHLQQKQEAHQREERQNPAREPQSLQVQEAGNEHQSIAPAQQLQQDYWEQHAVEEVAEALTSPELLPHQRTFASIGEHSQSYLSIASSPGTAFPTQLAATLTAIGEERNTLGIMHDLGNTYDDNGSDVIGNSRWDCKFGFTPATGPGSPRAGTDTPIERDHSSMSKTYNDSIAVLPPPGFEHVRIKPISEFAYARATPWIHALSATDTNNSEECLLLHLHRQLLLHCQRPSDAHLLPPATISRSPSTSNTSTTVKMSSPASYLDGVANSVWGDTFLTASQSPTR